MAHATDTTIHVSVRVAADLLSELDRVADVLERPRSWVIQRALRQYLDDEGAELLATAEGMAQLNRGEGVDFDEVMGELREIVEQASSAKGR